MEATAFDHAERTGADLIERPWLTAAVERSVAEHQLTRLAGSPGSGRTTLLADLARDHPDWLLLPPIRDRSAAGLHRALRHALRERHPATTDIDQIPAVVLIDDADELLPPASPARQTAHCRSLPTTGWLPPDIPTGWLPPGSPVAVRLVLAVRDSRSLPRAAVVIRASGREVRSVFQRYVRNALRLTEPPQSGQRRAAFARRLADHADGNFVAATILTTLVNADPDRLPDFAAIPRGLPGALSLLLEWVHDGSAESHAILGLLTVARTPLTITDLTRLSGLPITAAEMDRLRPLLTGQGGRYALRHPAIGEFLTAPETHPDHAVDPVEWHTRIVDAWLNADGTPRRAEPDHQHAGGAGPGQEIAHLADHLIESGQAGRLPSLVTPALRRALRARCLDDRAFTRIADLALAEVLAEKETDLAVALPVVLHLGVVRGELARAAALHHPPEVLGLAARMGHAEAAWELARGMTAPEQRFAALTEIVRWAGRPDLVERVEVRAPAGAERARALVALAHHHLDAGRDHAAAGILGELLIETGRVEPLRDPDHGAPFAQAGAGRAAGTRADLRDVRVRWAARARRRLFTTPAEALRAVPPGPSAAGNPHSMARTTRVFVSELARGPHAEAAVALAGVIADHGEAAVAHAALVAAAVRRRDLDGEAESWRQLRNLIVRMPPWHWIAGGGDPWGAAPIDPERLPAYAEIVRRNAGSPVVAGLADRVRTAAAGRSDEALLILAEAGPGIGLTLHAAVVRAADCCADRADLIDGTYRRDSE